MAFNHLLMEKYIHTINIVLRFHNAPTFELVHLATLYGHTLSRHIIKYLDVDVNLNQTWFKFEITYYGWKFMKFMARPLRPTPQPAKQR